MLLSERLSKVALRIGAQIMPVDGSGGTKTAIRLAPHPYRIPIPNPLCRQFSDLTKESPLLTNVRLILSNGCSPPRLLYGV